MSVPGVMNRASQSISDLWSARNARERAMLTAAIAVVGLGLVYALLIAPAVSGRAQLSKNLPVLRAQVAQMQALAEEAAKLSGKTSSAIAPVSKESIEAVLTRKGLKAQSVGVTGDGVRVQLSSVSFSGLLDWLDDMQKTASLSVVDANIVGLAQPDMVNATLTLRQPKRD